MSTTDASPAKKRPSRRRKVDKAAAEAEAPLIHDGEPVAAVPTPTAFAALGVSAPLDAALAHAGFARPFPVQEQAIPVALSGRDVCVRARTGSGKTLAFAVSLLDRVKAGAAPMAPRGLILCPTRELAVQVCEVLDSVAKSIGVKVLATYGGVPRHKQAQILATGVDIIVATPLRLVDLIENGDVRLDEITHVVVDEADRMADEGFTPQVSWVLRRVTGEHQTQLYSATLDGQVAHIVAEFLNDPATIDVHQGEGASVATMHHLFLAVHAMDKARVVASLSQSARCLVVFCDTKRVADRVGRDIQALDVLTGTLHGDLPQVARQRTLDRFAAGELKVLVATDVAARGLDIDTVDVVVHWDPANDPKNYLHRSGRTARAGREGVAVTLVEWNQGTLVRALQRRLGFTVHDPIEIFSNDARLTDPVAFALAAGQGPAATPVK
ncbi:MAG: DEAD/DEAH box helicase [Acidimicrobiia bacterium]